VCGNIVVVIIESDMSTKEEEVEMTYMPKDGKGSVSLSHTRVLHQSIVYKHSTLSYISSFTRTHTHPCTHDPPPSDPLCSPLQPHIH
jgi:hypothetical protein